MQTLTVSEQGQVVIPLAIRKQWGITAGCRLNLVEEDKSLRVAVKQPVKPTQPIRIMLNG